MRTARDFRDVAGAHQANLGRAATCLLAGFLRFSHCLFCSVDSTGSRKPNPLGLAKQSEIRGEFRSPTLSSIRAIRA